MISTLRRIAARQLFRLDRLRLGESATWRYLHEFDRTQFLAADEIERLQLQLLRGIVAHAAANCPFYQQRFRNLGLGADDVSGLGALAAFPILEKRDIQQHRDELVARNWPPSDLLPNHTGGSTGQPLSLFLDLDRKCSREAAACRHNRWSGWRIGDKVAHVWGASPDLPANSLRAKLRNLLIDRGLYLDSGRLTESDIRAFATALQRFRPRVIHAYAKSLALVARFLRDQGLSAYQPHGIVTSAETLTAEDRALIEAVFAAPVFNRYGCREVSVIASECEQHDGLHLMAEGLYVEVVDRRGAPTAPGELGSILVTDLRNRAMPLIRYRIGDMGAIQSGACRCGRGLPLLERVEGRITDFLVGTDGCLASGPFIATYLIGKCPGLGQIQIRQEVAGELLFYVTQPPSSADVAFIRATSRRLLGDDMQVEIEVVDDIPRAASGKLLVSMSRVESDFVARHPAAEGASR